MIDFIDLIVVAAICILLGSALKVAIDFINKKGLNAKKLFADIAGVSEVFMKLSVIVFYATLFGLVLKGIKIILYFNEFHTLMITY